MYFSFLPQFGILYPHCDCNLISTKESILQRSPLQSTTRNEGHRKSSPQFLERSSHSHFLNKLSWELQASPKLIFPGRIYLCSPQLQSCRLSALSFSSSLFSATGKSLCPTAHFTSQQLDQLAPGLKKLKKKLRKCPTLAREGGDYTHQWDTNPVQT